MRTQVDEVLDSGGQGAGLRWTGCWGQVDRVLAQVDGVLGSGGRGAGLRWTGCWAQLDGVLSNGFICTPVVLSTTSVHLLSAKIVYLCMVRGWGEGGKVGCEGRV